VGGSSRVDSRNIAASIVPFLRLPHPQDIYNFIVSGSLYWSIVEMSNSTNSTNSNSNTNHNLANLNTNQIRLRANAINNTTSKKSLNILRESARQRAASAPESREFNLDTIRTRAASEPTPNSTLYGISKNNWKTILNSKIDLKSKNSTAKKFRNTLLRNYNSHKNKYNKLNKINDNSTNNGSNNFKIHKMARSLRKIRSSYNIRSNTEKLEATQKILIESIIRLLLNIDFILNKQSMAFSMRFHRYSDIGKILHNIKKLYETNNQMIKNFKTKYTQTSYNTKDISFDISKMSIFINEYSSNIDKLDKLTSTKNFISNDLVDDKDITKDNIHGLITMIKRDCDKIKKLLNY